MTWDKFLDNWGNKPMSFGLKAQGHIPTIETMLSHGKSWDEIGEVIGWHPETAKSFYDRESRNLQPNPSSLILCVRCGSEVEESRACYAIPTCFRCLPPPLPLPMDDFDGGCIRHEPEEITQYLKEQGLN